MDKQLAEILAATARLEEQAIGTRRDIGKLTQYTAEALARHTIEIYSLQCSRATFKGWLKGVSAVSVIGAIASYFRWGG